MNTPSYLALCRVIRAKEEAQQRRESIRNDLIEAIIAALLAVVVGLLAV